MPYFYNTLIHKGKILEKYVRRYHPNLTELAKKLGYAARTTLYDHFNNADLGDGIILKYARVLKYDFKDEFPELHQVLHVADPSPSYVKGKSLEEQVELWKEMYYEQLAVNNRLLQQLMTDKNKQKK